MGQGRGAGPSPGAGSGDEDRELLIALDGDLAGRSVRRIAEELWGAARVAAEYAPDGWMRSAVRRRIRKGRALASRGYLAIAAGRPLSP